jgi:hypothetical protein
MTKPLVVLKRNVAEALVDLRRGYDIPTLMRIAFNGGYVSGMYSQSASVINHFAKVNPDDLLSALVNGYETEKTSEELAEEARHKAHEEIRSYYVSRRQLAALKSSAFRSSEHGAYADGIVFALDRLRITIEEVNV